MTKQKRHTMLIFVGILIFIAVSVLCRHSLRGHEDFFGDFSNITRNLSYCGIIIAWGFSVRKRIIQKQTATLLSVISALLVIWLVVRMLKWYIFFDTVSDRYCWYFFYIAMELAPALSLLAAFCLGKGENYRLPKWTYILIVISMLMILLVITNDFHQFVFTFPEGKPFSDLDHGYAFGYWIIKTWEFLNALIAIALIIIKSRNPYTKRIQWLPILLFAVMLAYVVLYVTQNPIVTKWFYDVTATESLFIVAAWEVCLQCKLIQTNTGYGTLFSVSTVVAQITDENYEVRYSSKNAEPIEKKNMIKAVNTPVILNENIRLSEKNITGGHIFWLEDISDLLDAINNLSSTMEELQSYGSIIQEENSKKERLERLNEKSRLYTQIQNITEPQVTLISKLSVDLQNSDNLQNARKLLAEITVIGAYIKRRSNLVLIADKSGVISSDELMLSFNESAMCLKLLDVRCACSVNFDGNIQLESAGKLYDFFESAIELSINSITDINVNLEEDGKKHTVFLMIKCNDDLSVLQSFHKNVSVVFEDGVFFCTFSTDEGGEHK